MNNNEKFSDEELKYLRIRFLIMVKAGDLMVVMVDQTFKNIFESQGAVKKCKTNRIGYEITEIGENALFEIR